MTAPKHPLPHSGGSYVRNEDGSLAPAPESDDPAQADAPPAASKKGK